ncbi:hypothetical protein BC826DRAFT_999847 [Russula brevipes]|nr:hypothetical protein BC826DRAFT_999847 [Russula brevipes]
MLVSGFRTGIKIARNVSILRLLAHIAHALVARISSEQNIVTTCSHVLALFGPTPGTKLKMADASAGYRAHMNKIRA